MGAIRGPAPVLPIVAILASSDAALAAARDEAARIVGPLALVSPVWPFEFTRFYEPEMGPALRRQIVAARDLADPGALAAWKRASNDAERAIAARFPGGPARPANLDPGYIGGAKLVLATTKDFAHRVYLGGGIYAEVTLQYVDGRFAPFPWTYRDWKSGRYDDFLLAARARWAELARG